ncbi:MAG TPA: hypothetical protein VFU93_03110 [Acidimicrobiales bacterium]|nr:hypothetical protein [Acidimicrobiales bacterium]
MSDDVHRQIGVERFNASWDLIDKGAARSPDDDVELLLSAMTSRWHWGQVGGPEEVSTGDWQVAHAACLLGLGDLALLFARRNLATATERGWSGWRLASAHEGMARASAVAGDADGRSRHLAAAEAALANEPDAEESRIIASQLATVPSV